MNNDQIRTELENKGYKVTLVISAGNYVFTKGNTRYIFESLQDALFILN